MFPLVFFIAFVILLIFISGKAFTNNEITSITADTFSLNQAVYRVNMPKTRCESDKN